MEAWESRPVSQLEVRLSSTRTFLPADQHHKAYGRYPFLQISSIPPSSFTPLASMHSYVSGGRYCTFFSPHLKSVLHTGER